MKDVHWSLAQLGQIEAAQEELSAYIRVATQEMCEFPGDSPMIWKAHWLRAAPFKDPNDFDHLVEGLRRAGLQI